MYDWACGKAATFPNNKKTNNNKKISRSFSFFCLVGKASSVQFCFKKKCALDAQYAYVFFFYSIFYKAHTKTRRQGNSKAAHI